jgi:hypothetical protein
MQGSDMDIYGDADDLELLNIPGQPALGGSQQIINPQTMSPQRRGRKPIPPQWTRVIDLQEADANAVTVFKIE